MILSEIDMIRYFADIRLFEPLTLFGSEFGNRKEWVVSPVLMDEIMNLSK